MRWLLMLCVVICSSACQKHRSPSPQSGLLVGTWRFAGEEVNVTIPRDPIRILVIGTERWNIQRETVFSKTGTVNSADGTRCGYWIVSDSKVRIGCGRVSTVVSYRAGPNTLSLTLDGENSALLGGSPYLQFVRVG